MGAACGKSARARAGRCAVWLALPGSLAGFYTWKIDAMDRAGTLASGAVPLLSWDDGLWILPGAVLLFFLLREALIFLAERPLRGRDGGAPFSAGAAGAVLFLLWLPGLLAFYPSAGMNDTVYMMDNPLRASIQFPWLCSLIYGYGAEWSRSLLGTREPFIFAAALIQMGILAAALGACAAWAGRVTGCGLAAWGLAAYFGLFPMVGNYSSASVRDPLYSLALLGWMALLWEKARGRTVRHEGRVLLVLLLSVMLLRSNGLPAAVCLAAAFAVLSRAYRQAGLAFLLCAAAAVLPAQYIYHTIGERPLFQEAAAIPLQQLGRVLTHDGVRSGETAAFMARLLPEGEWRRAYSPYTVDFVKWHDQFQRDYLDSHRGEFLRCWWETGVANPRLYGEGWMTETFALWNLDPVEHSVQSRFGWALSDANTAQMKPADNDDLALGALPLPAAWKAAAAAYSYEGSHFLGAGLSLWLSFLLAALLYIRGRGRLAACFLPLWVNAATLLAATPASAVFRYSFIYVLALPAAAVLVLFTDREPVEPAGKEDHGKDSRADPLLQ